MKSKRGRPGKLDMKKLGNMLKKGMGLSQIVAELGYSGKPEHAIRAFRRSLKSKGLSIKRTTQYMLYSIDIEINS